MHPTSSLSSGFSSIFVSFLRSIRAILGSVCDEEPFLRALELVGHPQLGYDDSSRALTAQSPYWSTARDMIAYEVESIVFTIDVLACIARLPVAAVKQCLIMLTVTMSLPVNP